MVFFDNAFRNVKNNVSDKTKRLKLKSEVIYSSFFVISLTMSIINITTQKYNLLIVTGSFALLCAVNFTLVQFSDRRTNLANWLFMFEVTVLCIYLVITGGSQNFSVIWVLLLPTLGLYFFGIKNGTILSAVVSTVIIVFFNVPPFMKICTDYSLTFRMRFPVVFLCSYCVSLLLEWIRFTTEQQLDTCRKKYEFLYRYDELTGMLNRYGLKETLQRAIDLNLKNIGVAMCDLDYYKNINDQYGHQNGDLVLKQVYEVISSQLTEDALIHRFGGEEFVIVYYNSANSYVNSKEIVDTVAKHPFIADCEEIHITMSIGHVISDKYRSPEEFDNLLKIADRCLYEAKQKGRNRTISATVELTT